MPSRYEDDILRALRRIVRAIDLHSRRLAHEHGLTTPQLVCLREVAAAGSINPSQLAKLVDLSQATITGVVDRLARAGLVTRERSEDDRRRVTVTITDRGRRMVEQAPSPLQEHLARQLESLPLENQQIIHTVLSQVVSLMGAERVDAAALLSTGPPTATATDTDTFLDPTQEPSDDSDNVSPMPLAGTARRRRRTGSDRGGRNTA